MGFNTGSTSPTYYPLNYSAGGSGGSGGSGGGSSGTGSIIDQFVGYGKESIGNVTGAWMAWQQKEEAERLMKKAKKLRPSDVDPSQVLQLQEIQRKQKAIESGTDPLTALATKQIKSNLASTQQGLIGASKGSTRTLVEGFARSEGVAGDEIGKLLAANAPRVQFYEGLGYDLAQAISTRAFDLQTYDYVSMLARATAMKQTADINASNLITNLVAG